MKTAANPERTVSCGLVGEELIDQTITIMGWVDRRRDLGNLIFLEIRDGEGILQVVVNPDPPQPREIAKQVRSEYVVAVTGQVVQRDETTINPELPTGRLEMVAQEIQVLNESETPPFPIQSRTTASEETRLKYRFLDLRRPRLQRNLRLRHRISQQIRHCLDEMNFLEIETPLLTRSTPEGARDYLVPSRLHAGQFYALPQSPQLFKQLLMVSGFDRYFQIARCFRDEDLRADRQPEFTQVDLELCFPQMDTVFTVVEKLLRQVFDLVGVSVTTPFPRMTYQEALSRYGTDRPDTRFDLELVDASDAFQKTAFRVFRKLLEDGGAIKGIRVPGRADYSRKQLDDLKRLVQSYQEGSDLSWVKRTPDGIKSSLPKAVEQTQLEKIVQLAGLEEGDIFLLAGGSHKSVNDLLGWLRVQLGQQEDLIPSDTHHFLWVYQFPLLEWDEKESRFFACNHPFTSPLEEDLDLLSTEPERVRAQAYDVVLDGTEIGGGSIRIHQHDLQMRVFEALGISPEEAQSRFGFFLEGLRYGAPPHGGIALGLDRIVMLAAGEKSLRDVIAFPKTARALDLMCEAPSTVEESQLRDLHIRVQE